MNDLISRQDAIAVADYSDYVGLSVDDVKKVTDEVVKGLRQLPSAQPWIPCIERLPKEYKVVLTTTFRTDKTFNQIPYLRMAYYCDGFWYPIPQDNIMLPQKIEDFDGGEPCVTAWMPLPEPYDPSDEAKSIFEQEAKECTE